MSTEADDVVEFQLLGQHLVEVMIAESAIGNDAHLDVRRQGIGQADKLYLGSIFCSRDNAVNAG